jgi:hypothetical protein
MYPSSASCAKHLSAPHASPLPVQTLRANKGLKELYLSRTQLSGELMCLDQFSTRDRLDVSNNALAGPMKACLLAAPFKELFLGGNRLTGEGPGWRNRGISTNCGMAAGFWHAFCSVPQLLCWHEPPHIPCHVALHAVPGVACTHRVTRLWCRQVTSLRCR